MGHIFISYRRDESAYVAGLLSDRLKEAFGPGSVYIDVDAIPLGVDFRDHINNAVAGSDVFLVVIGDAWLGSTGTGSRRIDDAADFVRLEIEAALAKQIPLVPVLIEKARMPRDEELPATIRAIAFRNAAELRSGRDISHHMDILIRGLKEHIKTGHLKSREEAVTRIKQQTKRRSVPLPHTAREAQVMVKRSLGLSFAFSAVDVQINGSLVGSLSNGRSLRTAVRPGENVIEVSLLGRKHEHRVLIAEGETKQLIFQVHFTGQLSFSRLL